jgi:hypothetical protein
MDTTSDTERRTRWDEWHRRAEQARVRADDRRRRAAAARAWAEIVRQDAIEQRRAAREMWQAFRAMRIPGLPARPGPTVSG